MGADLDDATVDPLVSTTETTRLNNAAKKIQHWWRLKCKILIERTKQEAMNISFVSDNEICTIAEAKRLHHAAKRIQRWWRFRCETLLAQRTESSLMAPGVHEGSSPTEIVEAKRWHNAAKKIQRWWRVRCEVLQQIGDTVDTGPVKRNNKNVMTPAFDVLDKELLVIIEARRRNNAAKKIQIWWHRQTEHRQDQTVVLTLY